MYSLIPDETQLDNISERLRLWQRLSRSNERLVKLLYLNAPGCIISNEIRIQADILADLAELYEQEM